MHMRKKSFDRIQPSQTHHSKLSSILGKVRTRRLLSINKTYIWCILLFFFLLLGIWWTSALWQRNMGNHEARHDSPRSDRDVKGYKRLDKIRSEIISKELEILGIQDVRTKYIQNWINHLERTDNNRLPKHALNYKPRGKRNRGRPRKKMATSRCRNRPNDLIHGGRCLWWWEYGAIIRHKWILIRGFTSFRSYTFISNKNIFTKHIADWLYNFGLPTHFRSKSGSNPEIKKKCLSPTMTKWAISGQSNFSGTTIEGRIIVAKKKSPAKDEECYRCFFNYYTSNLWGKKRWLSALPEM